MSESTTGPTSDNVDTGGHVDASSTYKQYLIWLLRFVGFVGLLAFIASVMPESWMISIAKLLTIDPFPDHPLTFYLARNLSLLYGFVSVGVLVMASDLKRYGQLVKIFAIVTITFGAMQVICNSMSNMPWWWSLGEGLSTLGGGIVIFWLTKKAKVGAPG